MVGNIGRVFGYARVSTGGQATEGTSLDGQRSELERYASTMGLGKPEIHVEVESAGEEKQERRVVLNALLSGLRAGDVVIVTRLDRFSRSTLFTLQAVKRFAEAGARLASSAENLDPMSPEGYHTLTQHAAWAQLERAKIKERTIGRRRALRERGLSVEGNVPLGYRREARKLVIVEEEAKIVRFVFAQSIAGSSLRKTHNEIRAQHGRDLSLGGIQAILRNRTYLGETQTWGRQNPQAPTVKERKRTGSGVWNKTHEPIVDAVTFERAKQATEKRKKQGRPATSWRTDLWLLRGIAKCAVCGQAAYPRAYRGKRHDGYYYCRKRMNPFPHEERCLTGVIERRDQVDARMGEAVLARLEELRERILAHTPTPAPKPIDIAGHRKRIATKRERWLEAFGDGSLTREELRAKIAALDAELAALEVRAADEQARRAVESPAERVRRRLEVEGLAKAWERAKDQRRIVVALAERVELQPGGDLHIVWKRA